MRTEKRPNDGILESFRLDFLEFWPRLPNKAFFLGLLVAWFALFHFLGNSTLGYTRTSSLLEWMGRVYIGNGHVADGEEAFALLIPFVVLGIMWAKRDKLLAAPPREWWPGLLVVMGGLCLHVLGYVVQQPRISIIGLFTGIYGLMGVSWGFHWLRASFFPFVLFAFCVPLGSLSEPITFRLRLLVCQLVEFISHYILQADILREGTMLRDPTGAYSYEVAAACSGIRSLQATFAFAVILAFLSFQKWWKRALVIASAFPLAVLGNLLRMLFIVIAAEIGGQKWGNDVHDSSLFSMVPYIPAFVLLLMLENYMGDRPLPAKPAPEKEPARKPLAPAAESKVAVPQ